MFIDGHYVKNKVFLGESLFEKVFGREKKESSLELRLWLLEDWY